MVEAARLKARAPIALGDCFAAATAAAHGIVLLTGDPELTELPDDPCEIGSAPICQHRLTQTTMLSPMKMQRMLGLSVFISAALLFASVSAGAAPPAPTPPAQMSRAAVRAALLAAGHPATLTEGELPQQTPSGRRTEGMISVTDTVGDVPNPRGDITNAAIDLPASGLALVSVRVATYESPFAQNWLDGNTGPEWEIITPSSAGSFLVEMVNVDGTIYAGVFNPDGDLICDGAPSANPATKTYFVQFPTRCLGNPQAAAFGATMYYENIRIGYAAADDAPNAGFSPAVTNAAYIPTAPCSPTAVSPPPPPLSVEYVPISPVRLLETRPTENTVDCQADRIGIRPAGSETELQVTGRAGVPNDAIAVVLNVTVTEAQDPGFIAVYPCGTDRPNTSNVNYEPGSTVATAVVAKIGAAGKVCLFSYGRVQLIADVSGYFPSTSQYLAIAPNRVLDTRDLGTPGNPDAGLRSAGQVSQVHVADFGGVPADASAVVLNVTAVEPRAPGFITVFPCGSALPIASNINYPAGVNVPNAVVVPVGDGGNVCMYTYAATHLVVDIDGSFPAASPFVPQSPARLLETRTGPGLATTDGLFNGIGLRTAGQVTELQVAGRAGVPADAAAVVLNLAVAGAQAPGFVAAYPCGGALPNVSNVNYVAGSVVANAAFVKLGDGGKVCLFTYGPTDLVVDIDGYFPA